MADTKISDLTSASALAGTEELPVVQSGATKKTTPADIATYVAGAGTALVGTSLTLQTNISSAAWTTNGIKIKGGSATLTDTSSSGTVASAVTNALGGNTIAASSATTFTDYYSTYISDPTAGTNVTITNKWSFGTQGAAKFGGGATLAGNLKFSGTTIAGLALNSLTTTQRDALSSPAAGWTIWNSTNARVETYNGTAWIGAIQAQVPGGSFLG